MSVTLKSNKLILQRQKELQNQLIRKKGKYARKVKLYEALDSLLGVRR